LKRFLKFKAVFIMALLLCIVMVFASLFKENAAKVSQNKMQTKSIGYLYADGKIVENGEYVNAHSIWFTATGLSILFYVKKDDGNYANYSMGEKITKEGKYTFYVRDFFGLNSPEYTITLDRTSPRGTIFVNGEIIPSESTTDSDFYFNAIDNSGISKLEIKKPNSGFENYQQNQVISSVNLNGEYVFRATDFAVNFSESSIFLQTQKPTVYLYADDVLIGSQTYTNASRIAMSATGVSSLQCFVKLPGTDNFIEYTQFVSFYASGRYEFFVQDQAQNKSDIVWIVVDREPKQIEFDGVFNGVTNGEVLLNWNDYNEFDTANIECITVNGIEYSKDKPIIQTIDHGVYLVESIDKAGNVWQGKFTSKRQEVLSKTLNYEYWETVGNDDKTYSFDSLNNATNFAVNRENALVKTGYWSSGEWNGGIQIDEMDKPSATYGQYFIYKSSLNSNEQVAYFTKSRLESVIDYYANQSVEHYYFWQKKPNSIYDGNDLYQLSHENIFIGSELELAKHANYLIDGQIFDNIIFNKQGLHELLVYDDWNNSYLYEIRIVDTVSDIYFSLNNGDFNQAIDGIDYSLNGKVNFKVNDNFSFDYSMLVIKDMNGQTVATLGNGEEYLINKTGKYIIQSVNLFGFSNEIVFNITVPNSQEDNDNSNKEESKTNIASVIIIVFVVLGLLFLAVLILRKHKVLRRIRKKKDTLEK